MITLEERKKVMAEVEQSGLTGLDALDLARKLCKEIVIKKGEPSPLLFGDD